MGFVKYIFFLGDPWSNSSVFLIEPRAKLLCFEGAASFMKSGVEVLHHDHGISASQLLSANVAFAHKEREEIQFI